MPPFPAQDKQCDDYSTSEPSFISDAGELVVQAALPLPRVMENYGYSGELMRRNEVHENLMEEMSSFRERIEQGGAPELFTPRGKQSRKRGDLVSTARRPLARIFPEYEPKPPRVALQPSTPDERPQVKTKPKPRPAERVDAPNAAQSLASSPAPAPAQAGATVASATVNAVGQKRKPSKWGTIRAGFKTVKSVKSRRRVCSIQ